MNTFSKIFIAILSICTILLAPISAAAQPAGNGNYVSLGDSVAAGAGLPLSDDSAVSKACGRSMQAYTYIVAAELGMQHRHLACGGATLKAGILEEQKAGNLTLPAQIDAAFATGTPQLITLTVGTNDVRWSDFIRKCYGSTCGTWSDTLQVSAYMAAVYKNLQTTFEKIEKQNTVQLPEVIVTGYFQPLSNENEPCTDTQGLTEDEISWVRRQAYKLNAIIAATAWQYDFVKYASVKFTRHELCSTEPWIQGLADNAPYHPTAAGQAAISRSVLEQLQ